MGTITLGQYIKEITVDHIFRGSSPQGLFDNYPEYENPDSIDRQDINNRIEEIKRELLCFCREIHDFVLNTIKDNPMLELIDTTFYRAIDSDIDDQVFLLRDTANFFLLKALTRKNFA